MQPPVQPFPTPQYAPPPKGPGFVDVMRIVRLALVGVAIVIGLGVAIFAFVFSRKEKKPHLIVENATSADVEVKLDGKSIGKISANSGKVIELGAGDHEVSAGTDKGKFTVPDTPGFRGLFAIGGKSHLAVVTVYYSTTPGAALHEDKVEPVRFAAAARLAALPVSMSIESMDLDKPFSESVDVQQGSIETSVVHLCHIHEKSDDFVGCPGYSAK